MRKKQKIRALGSILIWGFLLFVPVVPVDSGIRCDFCVDNSTTRPLQPVLIFVWNEHLSQAKPICLLTEHKHKKFLEQTTIDSCLQIENTLKHNKCITQLAIASKDRSYCEYLDPAENTSLACDLEFSKKSERGCR